jgi:HTH-type transcriptional regulator/antitoxin HigA
MPTTVYQQLLMETAPRVIETEDQYEEIANRAGELAGKGRKRTPDETQFMRLLVLLIQDYDRRHALPPDTSTPAERLQFLVEHSDKSATELLVPIFGQRSHVNEALNGKRPISATQARKLGKRFNVHAGLFL